MYELVYEHSDFFVLNKTAGANLHRNHHRESLLDRLCAERGGAGLHLVHRLDDATSGLLLIARNAEAAAELGRSFSERRVDKFYIAIAPGKPRKKQGAVVGDIIKARGGSYRLSRSCNNPSRTRFISTSIAPGKRCYLLKPATGKTHQLRVVMAGLGVPILGDERYGKSPADRCYLHAWGLRFDYRGVPMSFICEPSSGEAFGDRAVEAALVEWSPPWQLPWGA